MLPKLVREIFPAKPRARGFTASARWCSKFAKCHKLSMWRRTNIKSKSVKGACHRGSCPTGSCTRSCDKLLVHGGVVGVTASNGGEVESQPGKDPAFGRYKLNHWFSNDQVGPTLVNGLKPTYDEKELK